MWATKNVKLSKDGELYTTNGGPPPEGVHDGGHLGIGTRRAPLLFDILDACRKRFSGAAHHDVRSALVYHHHRPGGQLSPPVFELRV